MISNLSTALQASNVAPPPLPDKGLKYTALQKPLLHTTLTSTSFSFMNELEPSLFRRITKSVYCASELVFVSDAYFGELRSKRKGVLLTSRVERRNKTSKSQIASSFNRDIAHRMEANMVIPVSVISRVGAVVLPTVMRSTVIPGGGYQGCAQCKSKDASEKERIHGEQK